jgi:hypothetical protein
MVRPSTECDENNDRGSGKTPSIDLNLHADRGCCFGTSVERTEGITGSERFAVDASLIETKLAGNSDARRAIIPTTKLKMGRLGASHHFGRWSLPDGRHTGEPSSFGATPLRHCGATAAR